jgi:hypothetical protein
MGGGLHPRQQHCLYGPKGRMRVSVYLERGGQCHCDRLMEQIRYTQVASLLPLKLAIEPLPGEGKTVVGGLGYASHFRPLLYIISI